MAQVTVRDLLKSKEVEEVGIADIDVKKAKRLSLDLKDGRTTPLRCDVRKSQRLVTQMRRWDVVVNSTWYEFNLAVMRSAIRARIHYLDLGGLYHMTVKQLRLNKMARDSGVTCVLGMGSTPGTMNVMAAYAASKLDRVHTIKLRSASVVVRPSSGFQAPFSIRTIVDEFTLPAKVLRNGKMVDVPPHSVQVSFVMPKPVGKTRGYLAIHSELATLPFTIGKGLKNMDFAIAYPENFTTLMLSLTQLGLTSRRPMLVQGARVRPLDMLLAAIGAQPEPEIDELDVDIQRVEAEGTRRGKATTIVMDCIGYPDRHWDIGGGTIGTGTPPSIVAQWLAKDAIRQYGTLPPETCIEPLRFFRELQSKGRRIRIRETKRSA